MLSYSQSKQDRFAVVANDGKPGVFLDIGCSVPDWQSNSRLLLECGWFGVGIDAQNHSLAWESYRNMRFEMGNAEDLNWNELVPKWFHEKPVNYLSLDCDSSSAKVLELIMRAGLKFVCATVEHDAYRFGDSLREKERQILHDAGYIMIRENVKGSEDSEYEDWWVPSTISIGDKIRIQLEIQKWRK